MQELDVLIETTKSLEKRLTTALLSTWLFSTLAAVIQYRNFDVAFNTLVTVVGGILGTTAILSVYLGQIRHPSETKQTLLDFRPLLASISAIFWLAISAILFYFYYYFAKQSNEICLLFYGIGIFIFFRMLTQAASIILRSQKQQELWASLSPEAKSEWFNRQKKIEQLTKEVSKTVDHANKIVKEAQQNAIRRKKEERKENWDMFFQKIARSTFNIRKRFNLITIDEVMDEKKVKRQLENIKKSWDMNFHKENATKILTGKISPILVESKNISYYSIKEVFWYFHLQTPITNESAATLIQTIKDIKKGYDTFFIALVSENLSISHEGLEALKASGIVLYKYTIENDNVTIQGRT